MEFAKQHCDHRQIGLLQSIDVVVEGDDDVKIYIFSSNGIVQIFHERKLTIQSFASKKCFRLSKCFQIWVFSKHFYELMWSHMRLGIFRISLVWFRRITKKKRCPHLQYCSSWCFIAIIFWLRRFFVATNHYKYKWIASETDFDHLFCSTRFCQYLIRFFITFKCAEICIVIW